MKRNYSIYAEDTRVARVTVGPYNEVLEFDYMPGFHEARSVAVNANEAGSKHYRSTIHNGSFFVDVDAVDESGIPDREFKIRVELMIDGTCYGSLYLTRAHKFVSLDEYDITAPFKDKVKAKQGLYVFARAMILEGLVKRERLTREPAFEIRGTAPTLRMFIHEINGHTISLQRERGHVSVFLYDKEFGQRAHIKGIEHAGSVQVKFAASACNMSPMSRALEIEKSMRLTNDIGRVLQTFRKLEEIESAEFFKRLWSNTGPVLDRAFGEQGESVKI